MDSMGNSGIAHDHDEDRDDQGKLGPFDEDAAEHPWILP